MDWLHTAGNHGPNHILDLGCKERPVVAKYDPDISGWQT